MRSLTTALALGCMAFMLSACSNLSTDHNLASYAMTTGVQKPFDINHYNAAVYEPVYVPREDPLVPMRDAAYTRLENVIKETLESKGLQEGELSEHTIRVRFGLASEYLLSDAELASAMGLNPGLVTSQEDSKLTIGITLIRADTDEVLWNGALQGVMLKGLDPEQRDQRLKQAVATLLSSL